ncbi:MAG: CBS domain-containing protein [Acidobacteriota bacterium]
MTREPLSVSEDASMKEVVTLLQRHHIRHLPVTEARIVVGIVTDRDVRRASPSLLSGIDKDNYEQVLNDTPVSRIMTREPFTVTPETDLMEAVRLLTDKKIGSLPVVNGIELVGIFTQSDALGVLLELLEKASP